MRELFPSPAKDIDPVIIAHDSIGERRDARPWVAANMVMSIDGSFSMQQRSGGLSSPGDKRLFHGLRSLADAILVGAGTARAERYRRPSVDTDAMNQRTARGQNPFPRLAVVSASGMIPPDQPFREGDGQVPVVFTLAGSDHIDDSAEGIEFRSAGREEIDLGRVLQDLAAEGARFVLCEGGPRLLGDMAQQGLIDQVFLTLSPMLVGGRHTGLLGEIPELAVDLELVSVLEEEDFLLLNYHVIHPSEDEPV